MKKFKDASILIVNSSEYSRRILNALLKVIGIKQTHLAFEASDASESCSQNSFDVIITEITNGLNDGIALTKNLRRDKKNKNHKTPVLSITSAHALHLVEEARKAGISDLLQVPYSPDNIADRLLFALNIETPTPVESPEIDQRTLLPPPKWPSPKESEALTNMLMDHYLKHHEIVLTKLKFAQEATQMSLQEIKDLHLSVKETEGQEKDLKNFDAVWEKIITMFLQGGLSEQDLYDIEKIVTQIPDDIKQHYDSLTSEDKAFLSRVESLNKISYERAKGRVLKLQALPNPLNGKTSTDYQKETQKLLPHYKEEKIKTFFYDSVSEKTVINVLEADEAISDSA